MDLQFENHWLQYSRCVKVIFKTNWVRSQNHRRIAVASISTQSRFMIAKNQSSFLLEIKREATFISLICIYVVGTVRMSMYSRLKMQRIRESCGYPQSVPVRLRAQLGRRPWQESALTVLQQTNPADVHALLTESSSRETDFSTKSKCSYGSKVTVNHIDYPSNIFSF